MQRSLLRGTVQAEQSGRTSPLLHESATLVRSRNTVGRTIQPMSLEVKFQQFVPFHCSCIPFLSSRSEAERSAVRRGYTNTGSALRARLMVVSTRRLNQPNFSP